MMPIKVAIQSSLYLHKSINACMITVKRGIGFTTRQVASILLSSGYDMGI